MKQKVALLMILLILFGAFVVVRFFITDKQNTFGRVKIVSTPSATVFIDNAAVGKTPFEDKYKTGEFLLKLIPEGTASETASWQGKVKIYKNSLTYVNQELGNSDVTTAGEIFTTTRMTTNASDNAGEVYVETEPNGAIVYLDNDEKGIAPLILENVPRGDHEISVFMPGFLRRTQKINVDPNYRVNASFKLALDENQKKPSPKPTGSTDKEATGSAVIGKEKQVLIKDTPLGYLRVREEATTTASESGRVIPGKKYELLDEVTDWYKIKFDGKEGWVSSAYSQKTE